MPTEHYTRYLDLHVTASDKWYGERAADIALQLANPRLLPKQDRTLVYGKRVLHNASMDGSAFPETGYVVDAVVVPHIQQNLSNDYLERLIKWISNKDHIGKMRISAHGSEFGRLVVRRASRAEEKASGEEIASWLKECGLKPMDTASSGIQNVKGLVALCVAICYAGRHGETPPSVAADGAAQAAVGSTIECVVRRLRIDELYGIEVTGTSELCGLGDDGNAEAYTTPGRANYPYGTPEWTSTGSNPVTIAVPKPWTVNPRTVTGPSNCMLSPHPTNTGRKPSGGWTIRYPLGYEYTGGVQIQQPLTPSLWLSQPAGPSSLRSSASQGIVQVPEGWLVTQGPPLTIHLPLEWWADPMGQRIGGWTIKKLAHSNIKIRTIS